MFDQMTRAETVLGVLWLCAVACWVSFALGRDLTSRRAQDYGRRLVDWLVATQRVLPGPRANEEYGPVDRALVDEANRSSTLRRSR